MKSTNHKILFALFIFLFITVGAVSFYSSKNVFAETAIIISPSESQSVTGVFEANVDWTTEGASATCAYVYDDFGPTIFSSSGWTEVDCGLAGSDIPAPSTDGEHTLRVAAWLGAGFTSNATSDYVTFTYTANPEFSGTGDGTELDPYQITTCTQLQEMNYDLDARYVLANNIDCAASATWNENVDEWVDGVVDGTLIDDEYVGVVNNGYFGFEPIGQVAVMGESQGFAGTLDGQGYSISNLWIFRKNQHNGLIGYATDATIRNITLNNAQIVGGSSTGGFLGYGSGVTLEDLTNTNGMVRAYLAYRGGGIAGEITDGSNATLLTVTDGTVHGSGNVIGGLIGLVYNSTVTDSSTSADVDGGEYIGGAFGEIEISNIDNVDATGDVESNDGDDIPAGINFSKNGFYTGGFAGRIYDSVVHDSTASGSVTAEDNYAGGFAGSIENTSEITDSSATGIVSGNEYVGGFAGNIDYSEIVDSTATGAVTSAGSYAGGFTGESLCDSAFLRVSASGNVESGNSYVGGFTGFDACEGPGSTFTQAAAHGNVVGNNVVGGFIGYGNLSTFTNVYSSGTVTANDQAGSFASDITSSNLDNVYARGLLTVSGGTFFGGFAKDASDTTITDSFWDSESIGVELACQTGDCVGLSELTTVQATTQSTYTDVSWNFESVWGVSADNDGYPSFLWESFGPMLGSGTEEDPYQVNQCFDADESGYYELQNNISDVYGTCITIEADDVFIDGNGYTISGVAEGDEEESVYGIYNEGYDNVSITDITIESFTDGIRFNDVQGTSVITDVTIESMYDDGIELRGVSGLIISDSTITDVDDNGITFRIYYNNFDEEIYNSDIVVQNVVVSDTYDYGMEFDYVTDLVVTGNEISDTEDDDGISMYYVENAEITNNTLTNIYSDGFYLADSVNVLISENTIDGVTSGDGIDLDYDEEGNSDITITDNILINIGDNGIEITDANNVIITGNTLNVYDRGIDIGESEDITFSENTITPTVREYFEISTGTTESIMLDIIDADESSSNDYSSITYTLPFTFNFQGRDITDISVSSNGAVELLEDGESCYICNDGGRYDDYLSSDVLFASFDDLSVTTNPGDYYAVFSPDDEYVVVEWKGTTQYDYDSATYPIHFQVALYPDGEVQWNFIEMNFQGYYNDMFTGAYDVETGDLYRAGIAINEVSSYRADFSGDTEYELTESYDPITGIDLYEVSGSSFIGNDIQAEQWVYTVAIEDVVFNDSDSGNTYRLLSGEGAWTVFNIIDTNGNGYAESGTDRPFSQATLGTDYWSGDGEDVYPGSEITSVASAPAVSEVRRSSSRKSQRVLKKDVLNHDNDKKGNDNSEDQGSSDTPSTSVSTTRELQRFLNTNGFPIAQSGPGSLNNETDTFGELTRQALARFQQANGISPALGIFGPITKAFINKTSLTTPSTPNTTPLTEAERDLELGSTGVDVTKLQELLIKAGFPISSGATGYFGQQTKDALISYQKSNGIIPASGYFGPMTRAKINGAGI
jgi:parallel beta-helix repeat protein